MTEQEYEQKKRECFNGFCKRYRIEEPSEQNIESFDWIFDHAYALGKQEKDADTVTIEKEEYDELCKYRRYAANWACGLTVCPICGEYNPSDYICANCNNDKNWNK